METNYTPLDINKYKEEKGSFINSILMGIILITLMVLAVLLFILIQKKLKETERVNQLMEQQTPVPTFIKKPTPSPEITLQPTFKEEKQTTESASNNENLATEGGNLIPINQTTESSSLEE